MPSITALIWLVYYWIKPWVIKKILGLLAVLAVASIAVVIALLDSGAGLETMATAETQMQEPDPYKFEGIF